jgi:hypothetical protein
MASKKAGRLAGLAALAGLAYMNKDKLFGAKGATKDAVKSESKSESKSRDTDTGVDAMASDVAKKPFKDAMFEKEPGPYLTDDKAMYEKEPGFETKTTPDKVASASSPVSKPAQTSRFAPVGSPVAKSAAGIGNAKPVVAQGGDRSARSDMQKAGKTGNASPVVAQGGDRSTRSDNAKPVVAQGGDRSTRSDNAKPVFAPGGNRSVRNLDYENDETKEMKRGGKVKKMASGGMTSSASKRADGIATKGKTRGRMC